MSVLNRAVLRTAGTSTKTPRRPDLVVRTGGTGSRCVIDFGALGGEWGHSPSGDVDILTSDGISREVAHPSASVDGDLTTFAPATLAPGLTIGTRNRRVRSGVWLVTHTLTSSVDRWINLRRYVRDLGTVSATPTGTSTATRYDTAVVAADDEPMVWAAAHHPAGPAVALIPGNGYDNDWCRFSYDYVGQTGWYNRGVAAKQAASVSLSYGELANGSPTDFTVQLRAGVARDLTYVLAILPAATRSVLNRAVCAAYHDAFSPTARTNDVEKMLWATSHQLYRLKRHIAVEGARVGVPQTSGFYAPLISAGDVIWQAIGLRDPQILLRTLDLLHRLGPQDGASANGSLAGSAGNNLDGTSGIWCPFLELHAQLTAGYSPDATARSEYLATADAYATAITGVKMVPDASTRRAHYLSNLFAGPEAIGYGDFSEPFTFPQNGETRYRWSGTGDVAPTRVQAQAGVVPRSGQWMARLSGTSTLSLMRISVPPSRTVNATAWANLPTAWSGTGVRLQAVEYNAAGSVVATASGTAVTSTAGWQQLTCPITLSASAAYLVLRLDAAGTGTAYADDVQATMASPPFPGLLWSNCIMPPQMKGDTLTVNTFAMAWAQLQLRCLKRLLGTDWTAAHQAALDAVDATYPAAMWTSSARAGIRDDLYHPIRSGLLSSWALFGHWFWNRLTGEKIISDADVATLYAGHPKGVGAGGRGPVMFKGWITKPDGSSLQGADFSAVFTPWPSTANFYVNAGSWLWASDVFFMRSAIAAGIPSAAGDLENRLELETATATHSHESINAATGEPTGPGYGANVIAT